MALLSRSLSSMYIFKMWVTSLIDSAMCLWPYKRSDCHRSASLFRLSATDERILLLLGDCSQSARSELFCLQLERTIGKYSKVSAIHSFKPDMTDKPNTNVRTGKMLLGESEGQRECEREREKGRESAVRRLFQLAAASSAITQKPKQFELRSRRLKTSLDNTSTI